MSEHHAGLRWRRTSADFAYDTYNRAHEVTFKGGTVVLAGSAAPAFKGDADRVDPEEAFVGSLSACHMLTFLAVCARKRLVLDSYDDDAVGVLEKDEGGRFWVSRVTLRPRARFAAGTIVNEVMLNDLHHTAHEQCFVANSVKTHVAVEPQG
ncbi:MAG: OsmC family protein [Proteobacteria bacterium]|nr:OsmC family protein [Pseudomonadota bacterium]